MKPLLKDSPAKFFKLQSEHGFPMFKRGDIILTNNRTSWLAKQIRKFTTEPGESKTVVNHALVYVADGRGIEAGSWRIWWCSVKDYFKGDYDVYIMRKKGLTDAERSEKAWDAIKYLNRPSGLALYNLTGWQWAREYIHTPWGMICSGLVGQVYFHNQNLAPDDLYDIAVNYHDEWELIRVV